MVKNRWNESVASLHKTLLEQRVYTSRLLGQDSELVMHGGGNTSVKDIATDILGRQVPVLFIKGSGWDLSVIEKPGFPAVRLEHLLELRNLENLSDPQMVNELRTHLLDAQSPDPSVEALLHAFIPHRFVDHTHADAILTLTNQPDGEARIKDLFGKRVGIVPYVMPGFRLAKLCIEVFEKDPTIEGLVLLQHGIFSFGDTAKEAYDRMISLVQLAQELILGKLARPCETQAARSKRSPADWMSAIRREFLKRNFPVILKLANDSEALSFVDHKETAHTSQRGPLTPDHVIRTKRLPLFVEAPSAVGPDFSRLGKLFDAYATDYAAYFDRNCKEKHVAPTMLDRLPRVILIPGVGIVTAGVTAKDAGIAMDIYRHTAAVILNGERLGSYRALPEADIFDVEYWVLEQAKLKLGSSRMPLSARVAVITGGASGIGLAIAREFLEQGAQVFALDINDEKFESLSLEIAPPKKGGNQLTFLKVDVTDRNSVAQAFTTIIEKSGGIDITVVNAGIFPPSQLLENIAPADWKKSLAVNVDGALNTVAESLRALKPQAAGGDIIFIASKNVPAPGKEAGAYSVAKAAQNQLARVCALEAGPHGIRVNVLHPHLIFDTGIWSENIIAKRAAAYRMTPEAYRKNNLLQTELCSRDVARAAFALVAGYFSKTTGAQIPLDGGSDRTL